MAAVLVSMLVAGWVFWLASVSCARRALGPQIRPRPWRPPVSILKPVRDLDFEARENFISHCEQQYPDYEVLFGVTSEDEPAVPLIRELQRTYGEARVRLVVAPHEAPNPKAGLLDALARHARHDVLVATDSDVRLPPDGVARAVAPLADPSVGLVTMLYRGDRVLSLAAAFESLGMAAEFLPGALVGLRVLRAPFALGPGNALRRDALDAIGGFAAVSSALADDHQLGRQIGATGRRVEVGDVVISAVLGRTSLRVWWRREVRWARTIRTCRRAHYPGLLLTFSTPLALVGAFAFAWWPAVVGSLGIRWYVGWRMTGWMAAGRAGRRASRRWLWLLPVRDLLSPAIWAAGLFGRQVTWRGRTFRVAADGQLHAPPRAPTATAPEPIPLQPPHRAPTPRRTPMPRRAPTQPPVVDGEALASRPLTRSRHGRP